VAEQDSQIVGLKVIEVKACDIALFWDGRSAIHPDPDLNQIAIIVGDYALALRRSAITRRRQVEEIALADLTSFRNLTLRSSTALFDRDRVAQFFITHRRDPEQFAAGLKAFRRENFQPLLAGSFFPTRPTYKSDSEYQDAWQHMVEQLRPMDTVFTTCHTSVLSKFIAWATHGPWSHVLTYVGNGEIHESITSGIRRGSIELYRSRANWVAAYRHTELENDPRTYEEALAATEINWRPGYNYRKAIYYGARSFFGDHDHALVPNSIVYQGHMSLIAHA
jgi:hypothetical protein